MKTFQEFVRPGSSRDFANGSRTPSFGGHGAPSGSRTPAGDYGGSRTPAWAGAGAAAGSRTPAWMGGNDGGRTPAYTSGGKTPAWGGGADGGRTPAYGSGNRTPAWNPSSRTPYVPDSERSAWDAGSKTPGRSSDVWGAPESVSARTPQGGYNAPTPDFGGHNSYGGGGSRDPVFAPTPGNYMSAPTPGAASSPGPITAPTPGAWGDSAPTPTGGYGGRQQYPSTPGAWGQGDDDDAPRYAPPSP